MNGRAREVWVSYLRVRTPEQAAKDLSLPAQREAVEEYARRNGQVIIQEHLESGCSGTDRYLGKPFGWGSQGNDPTGVTA